MIQEKVWIGKDNPPTPLLKAIGDWIGHFKKSIQTFDKNNLWDKGSFVDNDQRSITGFGFGLYVMFALEIIVVFGLFKLIS